MKSAEPIRTSLALAVLAASQTVFADGYASLGVNHTDMGMRSGAISYDEQFRHGYQYEAMAGWYLTSSLALEGAVALPAITQDEDRPELKGYRLSGLWLLDDDGFQPYLLLGMSKNQLDNQQPGMTMSGKLTAMDIGVGGQYHFSPRWFGRAEIRHSEGLASDERYAHFQLSFGYRFGSLKEGLMAPESVPAKSLPDPTKTLLAGAVVSVAEPEQPEPEACVEACMDQGWTLEGVGFESNSDALTATSKVVLDEVVGVLQADPDIRVAIHAHTDSQGSDAYNLWLSKRRAQSVKQYLVDHGIAVDRLHSEGFGESRPIATNDTPQGRAANRRVELWAQP